MPLRAMPGGIKHRIRISGGECRSSILRAPLLFASIIHNDVLELQRASDVAGDERIQYAIICLAISANLEHKTLPCTLPRLRPSGRITFRNYTKKPEKRAKL